MNIAEWLSLISANHSDSVWLVENENDVHNALLQAIRGKSVQGVQAINELVLVFPYYLNSEKIKIWHKLNKRAFRWARKWKFNKTTHEINKMYVFISQPGARVTDRKQRSERVDSHELFELYLELAMTNFFAHPEVFTSEMANSLLQMARQINVPYYTYKIQQILALLFSYVNEFERAVDALNMSHGYWVQQNDDLELGLSTYILGKVYQTQDNRNTALKWYNTSLTHFEAIDNYPEQKNIILSNMEQIK